MYFILFSLECLFNDSTEISVRYTSTRISILRSHAVVLMRYIRFVLPGLDQADFI